MYINLANDLFYFSNLQMSYSKQKPSNDSDPRTSLSAAFAPRRLGSCHHLPPSALVPGAAWLTESLSGNLVSRQLQMEAVATSTQEPRGSWKANFIRSKELQVSFRLRVGRKQAVSLLPAFVQAKHRRVEISGGKKFIYLL